MANEGAGAAAAQRTSAWRDIPDAIQWHDGMLLSPQHFQQQVGRWEALLQAAIIGLNSHAWGLRHLRLDTNALPAGQFRVRQLEALFPDGTPVWYDAADAAAEELALDLTALVGDGPPRPLTIYLAVPVRTAAAAHGDAGRYRSWPGAPVADENTGEGALEIPRLRLRLRLFAGATPPLRYCSFPLAEVERRDEAFALTGYIAPTPDVGVDSPLHRMCVDVAQRLRAKALFLSERLRAPSVAPLAPVVAEGRRQIHSLVTALPPFEALLAGGRAPTWPLYLAFCALAGHVAALADSLQPPVLPAYRHDDLRSSFAAVRDFVLRAVNEGVSETYLAIPMEGGNGSFHIRFDASWAGRRLAIGIRRPAGSSESEMLTWGQQCLIGSEDAMSGLREKRILGLRRQLIPPGDELSAGAGVVLFELTADPAFLHPDRELQVLNNNGSSAGPAEVVLYVKNPES